MPASNETSGVSQGFDFLQGLFKTGPAIVPGMGPWAAPTLDPGELDRRINELKAVQFWLEQNVRMLSATIQGLEVQRLTLSTLQTLNLPLSGLAEALKARTTPEPEKGSAAQDPGGAAPDATPPAPPSAPLGADPLLWWSALTQQFAALAARAVPDEPKAAAAVAEPPPQTTPAPAADAKAKPAGRRRSGTPRR